MRQCRPGDLGCDGQWRGGHWVLVPPPRRARAAEARA